MGAAYGTAKSGTGIAAMAVMRPEAIMKSIIPVVMAGIIAIYGVVVAVLIAGQLDPAPTYTLYKYVLIMDAAGDKFPYQVCWGRISRGEGNKRTVGKNIQ